MTSRHFLAWAIEWQMEIVYIQPGKPTQNDGRESFNGKLPEECLNTSWFWNLFDARKKISAWKLEYNVSVVFWPPSIWGLGVKLSDLVVSTMQVVGTTSM